MPNWYLAASVFFVSRQKQQSFWRVQLFILLLPITNKYSENMTLIDGKAISEQVKQEIAAEVAEIVAQGSPIDIRPTLIGWNPSTSLR